MKINVKINNKTYAVEIEDLNARPIVAVVDGERFEVLPETGGQPKVQKKRARGQSPRRSRWKSLL